MVRSLRMRYCSSNFSHKKPTWGLPAFGGVAVLVSVATARSSVLGKFEGDGRKKIRLTKKASVRKRFGVDPWEQPIPKRWMAAALRDIVFHGHEGGYSVLVMGSLMLMSLRELTDFQVAQSHASRRSACWFLSN